VGTLDQATWLALTAVLTAVGAVTTVLLWRRRGAASGLRALAWTLLPGAAYLTGTLRLLANVADEVTSWAVSLVFSPIVWSGVVLAGASAALFLVAAAMRRRGYGARRRVEKGSAKKGSAKKDGQDTPKAVTRGARAVEPDDDMAEIESILRKHGIS
jgi:hypothetical protein